jgi:hypothetical protein
VASCALRALCGLTKSESRLLKAIHCALLEPFSKLHSSMRRLNVICMVVSP